MWEEEKGEEVEVMQGKGGGTLWRKRSGRCVNHYRGEERERLGANV